ncbi:MAG TPA: 3-deoxy-manno-octulosonate cytidylyltransferase [Terriglobales bacterium]|nr:3-deoxy-manno-octulosonate cytidylyltransferase [Terriglobales bacterium]
MQAIAVIPARLQSTRLARKVLREIAGQPLIAHVYGAIRGCPQLDDVIIATDSDEILHLCERHGFHARHTSAECRNGTERVDEIAKSLEADLYINVQGDELLARSEHIAALIGVMKDSRVQVGTLKVRASPDDIENPNAVKVTTDNAGKALYFSRSRIPYDRDGIGAAYFKHLGMYVYRKTALERYAGLPESPLEQSERLEQLRFLENGIAIHVVETPFDTIRVDAEEDLEKAQEILQNRPPGVRRKTPAP